MHHSTLSCHKMQSILLALALSAPAAAFAPSAQPRASVVRFMDEDALKSAASVRDLLFNLASSGDNDE